MANSKIPNVQLTDTFNTQRNRFNSLVDSVGDVSTLTTTSKEVTGAIKELDAELGTITAGAMGTTATTVSTAIAEIDGRLDSINSTQLLSPRMTLSDSSATNIIRGNLQIDGGVTSLSATSIDVTGNLSASNLTLDSDLTVHGIANLDSTNVVGQLDVAGSITAVNFTVSGAFTTAGATRAANSFTVVNDGVTVTNTNRAGLAIDRPSLDSAVLQWNELGDFWEIGTNQTDGGSSSDMKRVARQNDSAVFTNLMQSGTGATRIPAGTTAQRPSSEQGQIRYNTTNASFEGYSGSAWSGLGGLIDVDGDTKVLAERSAGNDSDTLTFFTAGVERLRMNDSGSSFSTNISGTTATFSGNITMTGSATVDGRDLATDGTKLDGIATNANNFSFSLPTAAAGTKGGVKVGNGLSISSEVLSHTDTSSQASSNNSGRTYIQDITLDTYGHVTGIATASETVVNTNTEYTVGDGGLTQKNFTTALNTKLSGIATNANNYSHPAISGSNASYTASALTGATVFSQYNLGLVVNNEGHVTSASTSVATRNLTAANVGALPTNALSLGRTSPTTSGSIMYLNSGSGTGAIHLQSSNATKAQFDYKQTSGYGEINFYTRNQIGASDTSPLALTIRNEDITVQGDVNSLSDVRTKENIVTVESGLDLVSQLRGVWYNKIGSINILDGRPEGRKVGVIAQEVEKVLPEVVNTDGDGMKSVDYGKMVGVLIEAIKELKQEIEELKG